MPNANQDTLGVFSPAHLLLIGTTVTSLLLILNYFDVKKLSATPFCRKP